MYVCVFGVNRGHTLLYFDTNTDTRDTEDHPRFADSAIDWKLHKKHVSYYIKIDPRY